MISDLEFASWSNYYVEEIYKNLYINSHLFNVESPEKFITIMSEYADSAVKQPFDMFAKRIFNLIMESKLTEEQVEIEITYIRRYINFIVEDIYPNVTRKSDMEVLSVIKNMLDAERNKKSALSYLGKNVAYSKAYFSVKGLA